MSGARSDGGHGLGEIVGNLATDLQDLVRGEVRLARAELDQKLDRIIMAAIWLVGGALVAFAGLVVLLQAAAFALAYVLPAWAAFLIVGLLIVVVGGLVARSGLAMLSLKTLTPSRTAASLQKDVKPREGTHLMPDPISETGRMERDLDRTRARLGSHLNELQDRLSPGQVLDDLMGYFRGSEGAEFGRSLLDSVRGNPLPAAITTVGLAWLMASNPRGPQAKSSATRHPIYGHDDHGATLARLTAARQGVTRVADEPEQAYTARLDLAHGEAIGLARHTEETPESFGARIRHAVSTVEEAVTGKAHDLRDQAGSAAGAAGTAIGAFGSSAQGKLQDAMSQASSAFASGSRTAGQTGGNLIAAITESPVILGALGMAAGALLGALLPASEQEETALGGVAGQVRTAVTNLANQAMESGGRVVQAVTDGARSSVDAQGLSGSRSPGELVDAALGGGLAGDARKVAGGRAPRGGRGPP